jgi:hypothetical protein
MKDFRSVMDDPKRMTLMGAMMEMIVAYAMKDFRSVKAKETATLQLDF